jgi:hypothetical protein
MTTAFATAMSLPQFNTARLALPTATRWQASKRKLKRRHFKEIDIRECPLWVKSGHMRRNKLMSALPLKADMCGATRDVCFGPIADNAIQGNEHAF